MSHTFKHTFHGKQYRVLLEVTDWRIFAHEEVWTIEEKQRLYKDKITISAYTLPQTMPSRTRFKRIGESNTCIFWEQTNTEQCQKLFTEAWEKVKQWTGLSDDNLPKRFKPYLS